MGATDIYRYSVVALNKMIVMQISKQDLLQRLSVSFVGQLIRQAKSQTDWIEKRMKEIHYSVKLIEKMQDATRDGKVDFQKQEKYSKNLN